MGHYDMLKTNLAALAATLQRLEARDDLTTAEEWKLVEVRVIYESIQNEVAHHEAC